MRAWKQFLQVYDCHDCRGSKGRVWFLDDVYLTVEPCERHQRMLDTQGWVLL